MSPSALNVHEKREFASEIKFVLDAATAEFVRAWARERLVPDPNASGLLRDSYEVTSLYFDTPNYDVFHRRGSQRYSKYRVRRYGGETIFFERKLKARGNLAKRRTQVLLPDVARLSQPVSAKDWAGRWFETRVAGHRLGPVCQITYERTARVLMTTSGPIRLTLDEGIRALPMHGIKFHEHSASKRITDLVVLELKYRRDLPVLFRELVGQFKLNPHPFSKYRAAVQVLGIVSELSPPISASPEKIVACQSS